MFCAPTKQITCTWNFVSESSSGGTQTKTKPLCLSFFLSQDMNSRFQFDMGEGAAIS